LFSHWALYPESLFGRKELSSFVEQNFFSSLQNQERLMLLSSEGLERRKLNERAKMGACSGFLGSLIPCLFVGEGQIQGIFCDT